MLKTKIKFLMVIAGPAGAGKTTIADNLKSKLSFTAHIGVDHIKRFISEFRDIPSHQIVSMSVISAMAKEYLKNDINVIIEQGQMENKDIESLNNIAKELGVEFLFYKIESSREILERRARERSDRLGKPYISEKLMDIIIEKYKKIDYPCKRIFNSEKSNTEEISQIILQDLSLNTLP